MSFVPRSLSGVKVGDQLVYRNINDERRQQGRRMVTIVKVGRTKLHFIDYGERTRTADIETGRVDDWTSLWTTESVDEQEVRDLVLSDLRKAGFTLSYSGVVHKLPTASLQAILDIVSGGSAHAGEARDSG